MNQIARYLILSVLILPIYLLPFSNASAAEDCGDEFYIDETLPNGARWDMCWEHRDREGITFKSVHFTPKNGIRRMVLNHAAIAQIHVPYDDNGTRFHDVSDLGIGNLNMLDLNADECPAGALIKFVDKSVLCKQVQKREFGFKNGAAAAKGYSLSLFSVSPVGAYYYIPTWRFKDDGAIEPSMGATGALQRFGTDQSKGWLLGDGRVGVAHLHNFFWKLDFDLDKTHLDDAVVELNFPLVNGKRKRTITPFNSEAARKVNPDTMRHWRILDKTSKNSNDHVISYDIVLNETGHQDIGPAEEPFTHNDFFVTKQNNNEKFASHNTSGAKNLDEFVNGESLVDNDIVIWAGITFYHMPRAEDAPHMDAHWSHLQIIPRDWSARNSLSSLAPNFSPSIDPLTNQSTVKGTLANLNIVASDVDGDAFTYSATGLPAGLSINSTSGKISGTASTSGNYQVKIIVSDGQFSDSKQFSWFITDTTSSGGGGTLPLEWILLMVFFTLFRTRLSKYKR